MEEFKVKRLKPMTKRLAAMFGGKWFHHPFSGAWECDDGIGACYRTHSGAKDMNGELVDGYASKMYVYGYGVPREVTGDKFWPSFSDNYPRD